MGWAGVALAPVSWWGRPGGGAEHGGPLLPAGRLMAGGRGGESHKQRQLFFQKCLERWVSFLNIFLTTLS